ncbi:ROK family protein [Jiangella rhizosphaerae]|uniref:ROK family protein n=1 Tax=Jiangella rhizosphaerae TaxID=2293569 RepID=A0A418KG34_9ACTN|nr:ROK family protein [Jiangella rhizosphaerae]RIQ10828.1 ROK family protein [Jiangella rhizosphaerae]
MTVVVAVDLGATKIQAAVVRDGEIVRRYRRATPSHAGGAAVLDAVAEAVAAVAADATAIAGIGVACAGVVDVRSGAILRSGATIHDWAGTAVGDALSARFGCPVVVDNDCNAFAGGLLRGGHAGAGLLAVMVGTGIGAGLVLDAMLYRGPRFGAGELAHLPWPGVDGARCGCGRPDHLEATASGHGIEQSYAAATGGERLSLPTIVRRRADGDPAAVAVVELGARALGTVLAGVAGTLDLDEVVLGGGVVDAVPGFAGLARRHFDTEVAARGQRVTMTRAARGDDTVLIGIAGLADDRMEARL